MARIAEDLLLLLLDNASARPALDESRRQRLLSAAVLLDLAHTCRIRPSAPGESAPPGCLVVLMGMGPDDLALAPALRLLSRKPTTPAEAIARLRRRVEPQLLEHLASTGYVERIRLYTKGFRRQEAWRLTDRGRPAAARASMISALLDGQPPDPPTAAIISLLYTVDGLSALLSLDDRGWQWVNRRAAEIASGSWVNESIDRLPEVNLAVTTAAIRPALG
jgi:Golgi phosphoprotein 3 (GPP34)